MVRERSRLEGLSLEKLKQTLGLGSPLGASV
jgi:hypothetical protein